MVGGVTAEAAAADDATLERSVELFKLAMPSAVARMVAREPGQAVRIGGRVGDQMWDLRSTWTTRRSGRIQRSGHHIVPLAGGAVGFKISGDLLDPMDERLLEAAAQEFKRRLVESCSEPHGVSIVTFDVDDTVITDDPAGEAPRRVPAIAALHQDMVRFPNVHDLARVWGLDQPDRRHTVLPVLISARVYDVDGLEQCWRELRDAGLAAFPPQHGLYLRPASVSESA